MRSRSTRKPLPRNWNSIRKIQLTREPLCRRCKKLGKTTRAREVDHIVPRHAGGSDEYDNLQSLCKQCHKLKSANEMRVGGEKGSCIHGTPLAQFCQLCEDAT